MKIDPDKIVKFYRQLWQSSQDSAVSMGWFNANTQNARFDVFAAVADLKHQEILDVGCGMGGFKVFLDQKKIPVRYTGIDLHDDALHHAEKNYQGHWILGEFHSYEFSQRFDYVFASGVLATRMPDQDAYTQQLIGKMLRLARKGIALNFLSAWAEHKVDENELYYYDPQKVLGLARKMSSKCTLRHDYLPNDFTLYLYH